MLGKDLLLSRRFSPTLSAESSILQVSVTRSPADSGVSVVSMKLSATGGQDTKLAAVIQKTPPLGKAHRPIRLETF